ncbi:MAG: DNA polymerase III subunit beta [Chitinophagales bacterium]|nr:DNA polymerase III subunit beta [Chitinophagales bacterium]
MKFVVSTSALLKQLQLVSGVIGSSTVLPILENFLFDISKGKLTIYSTDLETSMSTALQVEAKENGKVAIPAKILLDTLKTLPEQPLAFNIDDESYAVEIKTENGKYKLSGENGDDFPKIPVAENVTNLHMPASVLAKAISKTLFAVSTDELRPAMTGVYFQLNPEGTTFVATDAHKLVRYRRSDARSESSAAFIVPKKALNLLKSALPNDDTTVNISYNNSNAFFSFEEVNLICRLIDARYPDYNAVIPIDNSSRLSIARGDMQNSLKRIAIYSNKTTNQVVLKLAGSELQISGQDLDFSNEANERLNCSYDGADMEIGFNAKFLIEILNVLDSDEVNFELSSPNRAGVIVPTDKDDNEDVLMLVMPVMLNS